MKKPILLFLGIIVILSLVALIAANNVRYAAYKFYEFKINYSESSFIVANGMSHIGTEVKIYESIVIIDDITFNYDIVKKEGTNYDIDFLYPDSKGFGIRNFTTRDVKFDYGSENHAFGGNSITIGNETAQYSSYEQYKDVLIAVTMARLRIQELIAAGKIVFTVFISLLILSSIIMLFKKIRLHFLGRNYNI